MPFVVIHYRSLADLKKGECRDVRAGLAVMETAADVAAWAVGELTQVELAALAKTVSARRWPERGKQKPCGQVLAKGVR